MADSIFGNDRQRPLERKAVGKLSSFIFGIDAEAEIENAAANIPRDQVACADEHPRLKCFERGEILAQLVKHLSRAVTQMQEITSQETLRQNRRERVSLSAANATTLLAIAVSYHSIGFHAAIISLVSW